MADFDDDLFSVFEESSGTKVTLTLTDEKSCSKDGEDSESNDTNRNEEAQSSTVSVKRELDESDSEETKKKLRLQENEAIIEDSKLCEMIPRMKVHTVETLEACTHEVAVPPNVKYEPLKPPLGKPAKEYPFVLDPFQKEAILCLDNNQSVLVSAHTSAGKTVVAEYSIAMSLRNNQRVIYTTPIKALSNQKYREFHEEFKDVGLITGDVTINPTASVLIMTTEILRSMLYRGSEVSREVGWVVFDEIHYMRDKERGVVWEETLILLADNVRFVFLSATIPNARQFAEWVAHLHKQPCHVVYTDFRPVPLQHYVFPAGGDGIHLVVDENGQFKEDNFNSAMVVLQNVGEASKGDQIMKAGRRGGPKGETNCFKIVKMVMERSLAPVIIFSFSKKDCETYALQMARLDFNTVDEKLAVDEVFNNAMDVLSEDDRNLPQVQNVLPLLRRGIGIHHGGLLPILKECIEILFSVGLIKALFATETFAMGLNMPARTVLFSGVRKFDGVDFRFITSGEYIQMSGRAGRRGLDDKGIVILMMDEKMSPAVGKDMVQGQADPINSAFHLTYNMVLNLLRVEEINPEYMLERSFFQFQNQAAIPDLIDKVTKSQEMYDETKVMRETEVASYYKVRQQLDLMGIQFQEYLTNPRYIVPFLQPGRLIKVKCGDHDFDWGVVISFGRQRKGEGRKKEANPLDTPAYEVDVLLHVASAAENDQDPMPPAPGKTGVMEVVPILLCVVQQISSVRLYHPKDLRDATKRNAMLKTIEEVKKRFPDGVPLLHPVKDMNIKDEAFLQLIKKLEMYEKRMNEHSLHSDKDRDTLYTQYTQKLKMGEDLKLAKQELKKAKSLLQMDELKCRKRVLRRLGYCNAADVIEMKGRVACELSSADELLLTEMIFHGMFGDLSPEASVALLSCFVCDEKSSENPQMAEELRGPLRQMQDLARRIAVVSREAKLEVEEDKYVEQFKPFLMDIVLAWCKGATFSQICTMTDIFEGSIIRCMRRLEEALRQCVQAAKTIGNSDLEVKFTEGIRLLKRDIVFAASLYL